MATPEEQLDALYAELPTIECQGHCHGSCGPIPMSDVEHDRIARSGVDVPNARKNLPLAIVTGYRCPALSMFQQCQVYAVRPLICRLYGLTRGLPCEFGCRPSRWLTNAESFAFFERARQIGGGQP